MFAGNPLRSTYGNLVYDNMVPEFIALGLP